jgi:hypothetical protein
MPHDIGLSAYEVATIDRACRWIVLSDAGQDMLRSFIVNSISDFDLATKVSALNTAQLSALMKELQSRRKAAEGPA